MLHGIQTCTLAPFKSAEIIFILQEGVETHRAMRPREGTQTMTRSNAGIEAALCDIRVLLRCPYQASQREI